MSKRVFIIVCDSLGTGSAPDAAQFGDAGTDTLRTVSGSPFFSAPNLEKMGIFNIDGNDYRDGVPSPAASYGRAAEISMGKDSTIGHWEIAGLISPEPLPVFPDGFPSELIARLEKAVGRRFVCNMPYSGTAALTDFGEHHLMTGDLIAYTSADSVFQIAAHESIVPPEELYDICMKVRKELDGDKSTSVGRVIARPFSGRSPADFRRTSNRHDFSVEPPRSTLLDAVSGAGLDMISVGKIYDLFAGRGITEAVHTGSNDEGMEAAVELADRDFCGLAFINLVDFDTQYGHRRDIDGYARAISVFDSQLGILTDRLRDDDMLIITADHGCDPGYTATTDHTREYVPLLVYSKRAHVTNLGTLRTFADIGKTVCDYLSVENDLAGESFLKALNI